MTLYSRKISFFAFLTCVGLLGVAMYLQYSLGLQPCPLCVVQRFCIAFLALIFMIGSLYIPRSKMTRWILSLLTVIFASLGIITALRHIWIEHQPPGSIPSCTASLDYMLQYFPLSQTLMQLFKGGGDCAQVTWQFLSLSIPGWTLIFFAIFLLMGLLRLARA